MTAASNSDARKRAAETAAPVRDETLAEVIRAFIVEEVGFDGGPLMTDQADRLAARIEQARAGEGALREAKAEALREVADILGSGPTMRVLVERESCDWWTDRPVSAWLRERAAALTEGGTDA